MPETCFGLPAQAVVNERKAKTATHNSAGLAAKLKRIFMS
jgi:hypothetical protein